MVEQDNALLKGPLAVVPLFLKGTKKITAYVHVVFMALLLWRCMQAVMRPNHERLGITLPYPNGALSRHPRPKASRKPLPPFKSFIGGQLTEPGGEAGVPSRSSNAKPSCWSGRIPDGLSGFLPGEPQGRLIIQAGLSRSAKCKIAVHIP